MPPPAAESSPPRLRRTLAPLAPGLVLALWLLLVFTLARQFFLLQYRARLVDVPEAPWLAWHGLRLDLVTIGYATAPLFLLALLGPRAHAWLRWPARLYALGVGLFVLFLELASYGFLDEYDSRPNRLFVEYLERNEEVVGTILSTYPVLLTCIAALLLGSAVLLWRLFGRLLCADAPWSAARRLRAAPLVLGAVVLAARGGSVVRAADRTVANVTASHLANELVPNSTFTLSCALADLRMERSPEELYGPMPEAEVLRRVLARAGIPPESCSQPELPTLHTPPALPAPARPLNFVILLEESLGAQFVESLGGRPTTPNLVALGREGLWFERLYATGTRTVRGLEAVVCGFPPNPSSSVVKLGLAQDGFFSMAGLLKRAGYATHYIYGGRSEFDNMERFLRSTGFDHTLSQTDFATPEFVATWGVSDEDLLRKADEVFTSQGEQPFFALVLTTSNHAPFEFPDGKIELFDAEKATRNNSVKYADHALGEFFRVARTRPYFERTLFLIVADHDTRAESDELLPVERFHIPGLFLGPGIEPRVERRIASQIDLLPTALHLLSLAPEHPLIGRDLLRFAPEDPGRALLQYYNVNGYLSGDQLVIHQPYERAQQFRLAPGGDLEPVTLEPELAADALAHVLLPWTLYEQRRYRLP